MLAEHNECTSRKVMNPPQVLQFSTLIPVSHVFDLYLLPATMWLWSVAFTLSLAAAAQSVAIPHSQAAHEKRDAASSKWVKREKLDSATILPMRIGLKQRNLHRGYDFLMDV